MHTFAGYLSYTSCAYGADVMVDISQDAAARWLASKPQGAILSAHWQAPSLGEYTDDTATPMEVQ